jgi:hypothetical protein
MGLNANKAVTLSMTVKAGGAPVALPLSDTITAALYSPDGATLLSSMVTCSPAALGANWPAGLVVATFSAADTAALVPPSCLLVITDTTGAVPRSWQALLPVSINDATALFDRATGIATLRTALMSGAAGRLPPETIANDDLLWSKIKAAEAEAERLLKTFFSPVKVLPDDADPSELAALDAVGQRYVQEAGYDFESGMFYPDQFGMLQLGHRPVISVDSVMIATPTPFLQAFQVPGSWLRLDARAGALRFYPTMTPFGLPAAVVGMGAWAAGDYPNAIKVRYTAGLKDATKGIGPDIADVVIKMAVLKLMLGAFLPSSGSISADGLSQSESVNVADWQDQIDRILFGPKGSNGGLYAAIHGIQFGVI